MILNIFLKKKFEIFTFFARNRYFGPSLQPNQWSNDQMAWYGCPSTWRETRTVSSPLWLEEGLPYNPCGFVTEWWLRKFQLEDRRLKCGSRYTFVMPRKHIFLQSTTHITFSVHGSHVRTNKKYGKFAEYVRTKQKVR